jgi:hypothetical protein
MAELYIEFLAEEKVGRWGKQKKTKLNGLQDYVLQKLAVAEAKACIRGRAIWMYAVFDPLRFLKSYVACLWCHLHVTRSSAVGYNALEMQPHWNELDVFLQRVVQDGSIMQDLSVCTDVFPTQRAKIEQWRRSKYGATCCPLV